MLPGNLLPRIFPPKHLPRLFEDLDHFSLSLNLSIKIGMSDRFAYNVQPTTGGRNAARKGRESVACESTPGFSHAGHAPARQQRPDRAESKQGQDDTERSDVSACDYEKQTDVGDAAVQHN